MKSSIAAALLAATSFLVAPGLHLVVQPVAKDAPVVAARRPINWIIVADVSGSMAPNLPDVIRHFERELPRILGPQDTATLTWFSGRGQEGEVFTGEFVAGPANLEDLKKQMRRWLVPVGLTAFVEPLQRVAGLAAELEKKNPGSTTAMIFTTDGGDNCWSQTEILRAVDAVTKAGVRAVWLERGYWCNRGLMAAMAERSGGSLVFADSTKSYETLIEEQLSRTISGAPVIKVDVPADAVGGIAFGIQDGALVPFALEAAAKTTVVSVPSDMREVFYLSTSTAAVRSTETLVNLSKAFSRGEDARVSALEERAVAGAFAATAMFAQRMNPDVVLPLLGALGDVALIRLYQAAFTVQSYQPLVDAATACANGIGRWSAGYDPSAVPADDAPTIFDMMDILVEGGAAMRIEEFIANYEKIGRTQLDAATLITDANRTEIGKSAPGLFPLAVFDDTIGSVVAYKVTVEEHLARTQAHLDAIAVLLASKRPLRFRANPCPDGLPFTAPEFNGTRANLNVKFTRHGTVDFEGRETEAGETPPGFEPLPKVFPTFITRAYALVADGVVNVKTLPVIVNMATYEKLRAAGFVTGTFPHSRAVHAGTTMAAVDIDMTTVPVINRKMAGSLLAKDIFTRALTMYRAKCEAAVYRSYIKENFPEPKSPGFIAKYGPGGAAWLTSVGAHDYGWGPKKTDAKPTDFYMAKIADIALEGLSAVPSASKTRERLTPFDAAVAAVKRSDKGAKDPKPLPANMTVMAPFLRDLDALVDTMASITDRDARMATLKAAAEQRLAAAEKIVEELTLRSAHAAFSLVLGRKWPTDLGATSNKTMPIKFVDATRGIDISTVGTLDLIEDQIDI